MSYPIPAGGLAAVLAHPDDESFGCAGALALAHDAGATTRLLVVTRGEAGSADGEPDPALGAAEDEAEHPLDDQRHREGEQHRHHRQGGRPQPRDEQPLHRHARQFSDSCMADGVAAVYRRVLEEGAPPPDTLPREWVPENLGQSKNSFNFSSMAGKARRLFLI